MSDSSALPKSCPKCGTALPSEATDGLCPNCLMNEALQPTQVSDASKPKHSAILSPEELAPFFPQYEILRILGRGGMGAVYLARQISLNRLVAIKILPADLGESDMGFAERFKNEAQAMAQLSHACIVAVYDFGQTTNGLLYIVMEYIEGTDVQLMITSQGRLHSAHAMAITAHVCDALQYAHSCGIIHRDIKPSNIMVGNNGVVKVADFGLAKMSQGQTTGLTQSGMAMGTLHFMAPEALTLGSAVDQRADIYAVGVMLYQMLTGKLPQGMFEMPSFQVPGLDPRYDRVVAKALRDDRELRYQAALELRHDLDAILTQPVEKVAPEAKEDVAALPKVEARGKKKARVPNLRSPNASAQPPAKKKQVGLVLTALGVVAVMVASFVYFRDRGTGATTTQPALAAKEQPFVNSLGMKFVPVPGTDVLFGIHEVRYKDYAAYVAESPTITTEASLKNQKIYGYEITHRNGDHPVINASWDDAKAFCAWLSKREGKTYRLPTDQEWSIAVGLGSKEKRGKDATPEMLSGQEVTEFPWGGDYPPVTQDESGNYHDASSEAKTPHGDGQYLDHYDDGFPTTAPVMSYKPNKFGLYDMGGNVWEWCEGWWNAEQKEHILRGGSWANYDRATLLSSRRYHFIPSHRHPSNGFRCVLEDENENITIKEAGSKSAIPALPSVTQAVGATKDAPFTNTLGMKFVPVPGTKVLFCIHTTRVSDYAAFASETPTLNGGWKAMMSGETLTNLQDYPVANVSWRDAQAFCAWLSQKEKRHYRLPTDREWSFAVGIGAQEEKEAARSMLPKNLSGGLPSSFPWGSQWPPPAGAGNLADAPLKEQRPGAAIIPGYADGFACRAPVMSFKPNQLGLYDMGGNLRQWCEDWYDATQTERVVRGSSWFNNKPMELLSSYREHLPPDRMRDTEGFRCVVEIELETDTEASAQKSATIGPDSAHATPTTKIEEAGIEHPFLNSLGMKFVPVPIGGGPTKGERVLFSIWDTRVQDYLEFARANKVDGGWQTQQKDGVPAGRELDHPVVGVNWEDAQAFCQWLTAKENAEGKLPPGMKYRLPSDEEWSCAAGMPSEPGATPAEKSDKNTVDFPWGIGYPPPGKLGNYADETFHAKFPHPKAGQDPNAKNWIVGYDDGHATTSPVGSFPANAHGLHDMGGNVWQWCEDWYDKDQQQRVLRGASWESPDRNSLRSSRRRHTAPKERGYDHGFRCVLAAAVDTVPPSPSLPVPSSPSSATKDAPFVNTLGMKFVPVPETQVLFCIHEVRKSDYAAFAKTVVGLDDSWERPADRSIAPGDAGNHPVVNVNEADALAFCAWLGSKDGLVYRLPTDHEWSCAVGIGDLEDAAMSPKNKAGRIQKVYPWGSVWPPPSGAGNFADTSLKASTLKPTPPQIIEGYMDGFAGTAPVMSFRPNQLGIYDLAGNAWELCSDWYDSTQTTKVKRGGCWDNAPEGDLRSSSRLASSISSRGPLNGIRVVVERATVPASSQNLPDSKSSTAATKDAPFVNTLGMRFVPVPITGGPTDGKRVLFSVWETRAQDFQAFAEEAGHPWKAGDKALPTHPAAVNWKDIATFCQWLTERERKLGLIDNSQRYRITTDHEWSCAVGIEDQESVDGTPLPAGHPIRNAYPWGNAWPPPPGAGNFKGEEASGRPGNPVVKGYRDDFLDFSPVGSFPANENGLYDLAGNAWELCERDIDSTEGTVFIRGGSSANSHPVDLASNRRVSKDRDNRSEFYGFRIVLAPSPPTPAAATKDNPFVNTLGMKFIPLSGTKTLMSIHETRNVDYAAFATVVPAAGSGWKRVAVADSHPAVNVSWEEASAFCAWLSKKENRRYRLPADREWSLAVGIAGQESATLTPQKLTGQLPGVYPWGTQWPVPTRVGNYAGSADDFTTTAPVMSFVPNAPGFYDLGGNVWEFCSDRFNESGQTRVVRGASWSDAEQAALLSSCRDPIAPTARSGFVGFRCVLDESKP